MEKQERHEIILGKLKSNMLFGLFEDGRKCYFRYSAKVSYTDPWKALRELHGEENIHHKTLPEICPDLFVGTFNYDFSKHKWKKSLQGK